MMNNNHVKALMYSGAVFLSILSIIAAGLGISYLEEGGGYFGNTISVTGTGEVSSEPDIATFSFTVEETAATTKEAQDVISEKVANILESLEDLDIKDKDIKTQSYAIHPKYEWVTVIDNEQKVSLDGEIYIPRDQRKNVQVGFDVSQNISVQVRDFDLVSEVLEMLGSTGVENLNGPNFEIEDPDALENEAREIAIKEAKEKAQDLAKSLDVKLGDIVDFSEGGYGGHYLESMYDELAMIGSGGALRSSYSPELPTGENEVQKTVTIMFEIK
jgi:hypothetical protein